MSAPKQQWFLDFHEKMVGGSWPCKGVLPLISVRLGFNPVSTEMAQLKWYVQLAQSSTKNEIHLYPETDAIFACF